MKQKTTPQRRLELALIIGFPDSTRLASARHSECVKAGLGKEHLTFADTWTAYQNVKTLFAENPDWTDYKKIDVNKLADAVSGIDADEVSRVITDRPTNAVQIMETITRLVEAEKKRRIVEAFKSLINGAESSSDAATAMLLAKQTLDRLSASIPTEKQASSYPLIVRASDFTATPIDRPVEVIGGALYLGGKLVYGGPSKAFKSWSLVDLVEAVAVGGEWLGLPCKQGNALYINLELIPYSVQQRVYAVAQARGHAVPDALRVWNLRGHSCPLDRLLPELLRQIEGEQYSLIVVDPIYKTLAGREENDTGAIGEVCNEIEQVAIKTGAAVAFGSHFAKGNASGKNAIDRISGSGVFARDPDAILTATPHATEGAFTMELTLRDFAPVDPFTIRWEYPRMVRDLTLDPADLKQVKAGRTPKYAVQDIMGHIGTEPISAKEWERVCRDEEGFDSPRGCQFERTACRPVIYNNRWPLFLPKNGKVTSEVTSSPIWFYAVPLESDSPDSIFFTPSL